VITQFDGLLVTIGDGQGGQDIHGQQNGTGIATNAANLSRTPCKPCLDAA
jgi:hypothetical protein